MRLGLDLEHVARAGQLLEHGTRDAKIVPGGHPGPRQQSQPQQSQRRAPRMPAPVIDEQPGRVDQ
jgi:hypothetical protein